MIFRFVREKNYYNKKCTLNPKYKQLCIHRWYLVLYVCTVRCDCYAIFVTVHWKMNIFGLKWHDTAKKVTETTELFFIFIFFFFFFAYFPLRFEAFSYENTLLPVYVLLTKSRVFISHFLYSKNFCMYSIRTSLLTLLAGVKSWNEIISRNIHLRTLKVLTFVLLCFAFFSFVVCVCVANYCIYSFDSVILFNCFFFFSLFTW